MTDEIDVQVLDVKGPEVVLCSLIYSVKKHMADEGIEMSKTEQAMVDGMVVALGRLLMTEEVADGKGIGEFHDLGMRFYNDVVVAVMGREKRDA